MPTCVRVTKTVLFVWSQIATVCSFPQLNLTCTKYLAQNTIFVWILSVLKINDYLVYLKQNPLQFPIPSLQELQTSLSQTVALILWSRMCASLENTIQQTERQVLPVQIQLYSIMGPEAVIQVSCRLTQFWICFLYCGTLSVHFLIHKLPCIYNLSACHYLMWTIYFKW